jgi:hypothetical protein
MKSLVRFAVAALVLTGAIATTHAATTKPTVKTVSMSMSSFGPTPTCPPDGGGCGW